MNILVLGVASILLLFLLAFLKPNKSMLVFGVGIIIIGIILVIRLMLKAERTYIENYIPIILSMIAGLILAYQYFKGKKSK